MQNKKAITTIIVAIIVGAGAFFGGMAFGKSRLTKQDLLRNMNVGSGGGDRQGGARSFAGGQRGPNGAQGDFVVGGVIAKDDKSVTIKNRDGGSKIVFFSDSTTVGKSVSGSADDLANGQQVMAGGKTNSDGTFMAENIQIRPAQ